MTTISEQVKKVKADPDFLRSLPSVREWVAQLEAESQYGPARELIATARSVHPDDVWLTQRLAFNTYQDEELLPAKRFEAALRLLEDIGLRDPATRDPETLGLGGGICVRMWDSFGQLESLYEALVFFRAAYHRNPSEDLGRGGINAAFICDLLAARAGSIAQRSGTAPSAESDSLRAAARELRQQILADLVKSLERDTGLARDYCVIATLAETCFGLGDYDEAGAWLSKLRDQAASLEADARESKLQNTFRQLVLLARNQGIELPDRRVAIEDWHPAWKSLRNVLGDGTHAALLCYRGKVGLGLSGGGFRASLFHLGVLARLAEVDALSSIEVMSTVSGGSIVGVHYYLELQRLIEQKADSNITREDYIAIVRRIQDRFLSGVQRNIRVRAFENFRDNIRMLLRWGYTRSHKLGELYESELYTRIDDRKNSAPRIMPQLLVHPTNEAGAADEDFNPRFSNWRRHAKVPVLLLNTTSLNSGHNWFFTGSWMGEPPGLLGAEADVNERYRRLYYRQAPNEALRNFRLGYAVAGSSCVPGLFDPLVIDGLYPERTVRLVDGGVHDNQGIQGLLDEGCTLILCSDASGQMADLKQPGNDPAGVLLRVTTILQDRVREAQLLDLRGRLDSRSLEGLFFIHTKKELQSHPLDWVNCDDPTPVTGIESPMTSYGVAKDLQAKIAELRTDLDSFTEVEAYSLMASGYQMAKRELEDLQQAHAQQGKTGSWGSYDIEAGTEPGWPFQALSDLLAQPAGTSARRDDLSQQLDNGKTMFLKAWKVLPPLQWRGWLGLAALFAVLAFFLSRNWQTVLLTWGGLTLLMLTVIAAIYLPATKWLNPTGETRSFLAKLAIALVGYVLAKIHLNIIDPLFLARGKLERLLR